MRITCLGIGARAAAFHLLPKTCEALAGYFCAEDFFLFLYLDCPLAIISRSITQSVC